MLKAIYIDDTQVSDLAPLSDLRLEALRLDFSASKQNLTMLRSMKSLKSVNEIPAGMFWEEVLPFRQEMARLHPDLRLNIHPFESGIAVSFFSDGIEDISTIANLKSLKALSCMGSGVGKSKLADLSPLRGLRLNSLDVGNTEVSDLSPLEGMALTILAINNTKVSDLSPISRMPLKELYCEGIAAEDTSPLRGMSLRVIQFDFRPERDAELLQSLKSVEIINRKPAADFLKEVRIKP